MKQVGPILSPWHFIAQVVTLPMTFTTEGIKENLRVTNLVEAQVRLDHMRGFRDTMLNMKGAPVSYL